MSGQAPREIWGQSAEEGERRLSRGFPGLLATGFVGGVDVMLGIVALTVTAGAVSVVLPHATAHVIGSLAFGVGFVLLVIGRSELFTENFMVPVSTVIHGRKGLPSLGRLWTGTLVGNLCALFLFSYILTRAGLVPPETLETAGKVAETFAEREAGPALLSAVVAGSVMTLLTWLAHAARSDGARIAIALLIGFLLSAPSLNHAVVSVGEMAFGILADTGAATWTDLAQNFPLAVIGNLAGGLAFVTLARLVQVRGEPAAG